MTLTKIYFGVDGELLGELDSNGTTNYANDAVGSVVGRFSPSSGTAQDTTLRSPYGLLIGGAEGVYGWLGALGVRSAEPTNLAYARTRHLQKGQGRWITVDPLWPEEPAYPYAEGNPTTRVDPSGLACNPKLYATLSNLKYSVQCTPYYAFGWHCWSRCNLDVQYKAKFRMDTRAAKGAAIISG